MDALTVKPAPPINERWLLLTLAGIQFTHVLDFMILMPLGPELRRVFAITDTEFALLVSAYTLASGLSGLLASAYVDRFERKRLLLTLYSCFAVAALACALAPTYTALLGARLMAGAFGGVLSAMSNTIVSDTIAFERRGKAMSVVMSSFSVSSIVGVPLGLILATHFNWHAPFFLLAVLISVLAIAAWRTLPKLDAHLQSARAQSPLTNMLIVVSDRNHQRAFAFSACLLFAGFTVIPFMTLYLTSTVRIPMSEVHWIYLFGGTATLISARLVGRFADSWGKFQMYRLAAAAVCVPMLVLTNLPPVPLWALLICSTTMFVCMNSRMIPGMALVSGAANPALRGTFLSMNGAVHSTAIGLASLVGGMLVGRDAAGNVTQFWMNGLLGASMSLLSIGVASRLKLSN